MTFTRKQLETMEFIANYIRENRISPSLREIAKHRGVSVITVFEMIKNLEAKGALQTDPKRKRSIEILAPEFKRTEPRFMGVIRAGEPLQVETTDEKFSMEFLTNPPCDSYILRVDGDSMVEDGIINGDYVLVESTSHASDGQTVVANIDGNKVTLKKYFKENGRIRLQPANSSMEPIHVDSCEIRGVVRGVMRQF